MKLVKLSMAVITLAGGLVLPAAADLQEDVARLGVRVLAEKFGVDGRVADRYLAPRDVFEAAPCFSMSHYSRRPIGDVWKLRQQGLGWGQIAHRLGMHPGQFNKLRKSGAFDRDRIWGSILKERYGARDGDILSIKKKGGSMEDAVHAHIIAHKSGGSASEVFDHYRKGRDWDHTAKAHKGGKGDHEPSDHAEHGHSHKDKVDQGPAEHGHGHGKGKAGGKGRGRGNG